MHRRRSLIARLLVVCLGMTTAFLVQGQPANAGTCSLDGLLCGEVINNSSAWVMIGGGSVDTEYGWCWEDNAPRYAAWPPCINTATLPAGSASSTGTYDDGGYFKDADSFRVDAGCVLKYTDVSAAPTWLDPYDTRVEDRRGKASSKWIKLTDRDTILISYQSCAGTPTKYYVNTWDTATGYQDQHCYIDTKDSTDHARCNADGVLYANNNYFFCKIEGERVGTGTAYNHYWLLTDLDAVNKNPDGSDRDGRSFVSAYYLTGGPNDTQNDSAYYYSGNSWQWIPDC